MSVATISKPRRVPLEGLISGLIGGLIFLVFYFLLEAGVGLSMLVGAAGLIAYWLMRGRRSEIDVLLDGVTREELKDLLQEVSLKLETIQGLLVRIRDRTVTSRIQEILGKTHEIIQKLKTDPQYLNATRRFFSYYLEALSKIVDKYAELESHRELGGNIARSVDQVQGALNRMQTAFNQHHQRLLEGDLMSLEAEIALLEKTTRLEFNHE